MKSFADGFGRFLIVAALAGLALTALPERAEARVFVGLGVPFYGPAYVPPPAYYPPPVYYAPPPVYYTPPPTYSGPPPTYSAAPGAGSPESGQSCYAGAYVCPMERQVASGVGCYCTGNAGQKVWGRAN